MCLGTLPIILKNLIIDRRWLNICLGGLVVFSTVISYSRSLWVAVAFQIFLFMSLEYYEQKKIESRMLVFGIALVCLFTGSIYYSDIFNYAYEIRPSTFEGRWYGFKSGLESVTGSVVTLLFGVGKGQFVDEMYSRLGRGLVVHNFVLDLLVSKGLIALIFVMSIVFWILRDLVEILRSPGIRRGAIKDYAGFLLIGIGGMLMEGMFDPITNSIYLWTFLALASAFIAIARQRRHILMLRILYISGKRAREIGVLRYLEQEGRIKFDWIRMHLRSMDGFSIARTVWEIASRVGSSKLDAIVLEGPGFSKLPGLVAGKVHHVPVLVRLKGDTWKEYKDIQRAMPVREKGAKFINYYSALIMLRWCDAVLPISGHIKEQVARNITREKACYVMHIPYRTLEKACEEDISISGKTFVLSVTNFNFWAKVDPLLRAVRRLSELLKKKGLSWIILGEGFFFEEFKREIQGEIDSGVVKMPGRVDPLEYYKEAKALFYISGTDGLPNVLLEAFLCELPVVIDEDCPAVQFELVGRRAIVDFGNVGVMELILDAVKDSCGRLKCLQTEQHNMCGKVFPAGVGYQLESAIRHVCDNHDR